MSLHLIRTRPDENDYTAAELKSLKARRAAQNERVVCLANGTVDAVPTFDPIPFIPGVPNPQSVYDEDFRDLRGWQPWLAEKSLLDRMDSQLKAVYDMVKAEVDKLSRNHRIVVPVGTIPGFSESGINVRQSLHEQLQAAKAGVKRAMDGGEDLWFNNDTTALAGIMHYLKSIGKTPDYLES